VHLREKLGLSLQTLLNFGPCLCAKGKLRSHMMSQPFEFMTMARFHPWFNPWIRVVSRVLDQELMCALMEKTQDLIRNTKWNRNDEFPRRVLSWCCTILRACGNKSISPWRNMHTVLAILPMKMSILLETWSYFYGSLMLIAFEFACNSSYSFGETSE